MKLFILFLALTLVLSQDFPDECIDGPYLAFLGCDTGAVPIGDLCIKESCLVTTGATPPATNPTGQSTQSVPTNSFSSTVAPSQAPMSFTSNAPCADTSNQCNVWIRNGFCNSTFYPETVKRTTCGISCHLCSSTSTNFPSTAKPCNDLNAAECKIWSANGFCSSNFYPEQIRRNYCAKTCNLC